MADNDGILWLNGKHTEEGLDHKSLREIQIIENIDKNQQKNENFAARLKLGDLVNKTDFDNKLTSFNRRIASNKRKHLEVQKKLNSLITVKQ